MVFILQGLEAKDNQHQVLEGDVVEMGETAQILSKSYRPVDHIFSFTVLQDEAEKGSQGSSLKNPHLRLLITSSL